MLRVSRLLIAATLVASPFFSLLAQNPAYLEYHNDYSHRELSTDNPEYNAANPFQLFHYHDMTGFNDVSVGEGCYVGKTSAGGTIVEFMNWRIILPRDYNASRPEKYPMIVMLHGAGEGGRLWSGSFNYQPNDVRYDNNSLNVAQAGPTHMAAAAKVATDPKAFPGIVIFPQANYNAAWESNWDNGTPNQNSRMVEIIIRRMIEVQNADPDRIYVHGLSNGAKGTWDFAAKHPDLVAAILPMSGTPSDPNAMVVPLVTTPVWLFQGGVDTNPRPQASLDAIAVWNAAGGVIRYTLYPTLGHGTWGTAYNEPDFWSWMLSQSKKKIYVFGGDPTLCPGGTLKLGVSAGFTSYQWMKDGADISGEVTRYLNVTATGTYKCRYKRTATGAADQFTNDLVVSPKSASTYSPPVTNTGSLYETVDKGGVINFLTITAPTGSSEYRWYKGGSPIAGANPTTSNVLNINTATTSPDQYGKASDAGIYTVTMKEGSGCTSLPSPDVQVYYTASQPAINPAITPTLTTVSQNTINLSWADYGSEIGYELYRYRDGRSINGVTFPTQGWSLIKVLPPNTLSYVDKNLRPNSKYLYSTRALLSNGTAVFSSETDYNGNVVGVTSPDNSPPTVPTGLVATGITQNQFTLSWTASDDDDLVYKYRVYNGATLLTTLTGADENTAAATSFLITGLVEGSTNIFTVQAVDFSGNVSPLADALTVTMLQPQNGLTYKYWPTYVPLGGTDGQQLLEPGGVFNFAATPAVTGIINSPLSSVSSFEVIQIPFQQQNTNDPNDYVMSFDGYVNITTAGTYTFQTSGNTANRLYFNTGGSPTTSILTNDGVHNPNYTNLVKQSTAVTLSVGKYPIRVTYYDDHAPTLPNQGANPPSTTQQFTNLRVLWRTTPTGSFVAIPNNQLFLSGTTFTNYYLVSSANPDPSLLASWTTKANGTAGGTAPLSFTANYQIFNIVNQATVNLAANKTLGITGTGSKMVVAPNVTLNLNGATTGTMDAGANSVINVYNAIFPAFGSMAANSNVNFNVPGGVAVAIPNATYGNLNLQTPNPYTFPLSTTTVQGNLNVAANSTTVGAAGNVAALRVAGDLTFSISAGNPFPLAESQRYSLVFTGGKNHTVSFTNGVDPYIFSLKTDFGDNVTFVNPGTHTYTFGSSIGGGLILQAGSTLNLGAGDLVIAGKGTINSNSETGVISVNDGSSITLTTTAPRNSDLLFKNGTATLNNLTVSSATNTSINLKSTTNIQNLVTLSGGSLNAGNEANLVLLSDTTTLTTARIGPIASGARINGNIVAQRYMPSEGVKVYQYISSPVKYATVAMLQESFPVTGNFTGKSTIPGVSNPAASMFWYGEPTYRNFPANGGTNADTLKAGRGYTAYIRKADGSTTWSVEGNPNQGAINFAPLMTAGTGSPNDGWNLIGNPYPAPIKWTGSATGGWSSFSNLSNTVYVRENNASGYQWHVYRTGITSGDLQAGQVILDNGIIASGQAFWVQASGTPSLTITEAAKQTDDGVFYRTTGAQVSNGPDVMSISLSDGTLTDIAFLAKDDAGTEYYEKSQDAVKQLNSTFNFSTLSKDNVPLVINVTPKTYCEKNTRLSITNAAAGSYTMKFNGLDKFNVPVTMTLIDHFLNTTTPVTPGYVHSFTISSDTASFGKMRFVLRESPLVNTSLVLKSNSVCETNPSVVITSPQSGVVYQAYYNGLLVSDGVPVTTDSSVTLQLKKNLLGVGQHNVTVTGGFASCENVNIGQSLQVVVDSLQTPSVISKSGILKAIPANADAYQWLEDGKVLNGKTESTITMASAGAYQVQVTSGSCTKISDVYVVTGIGESKASVITAYPNPFNDKITVTLPEPLADGNAVVYNTVGQPVQTAAFTTNGGQTAEMKFTNLEPGAYILGIGRYKIKVIKVN